ncbi:MAG: hypothetical protein ACT4N4_11525 [Rhodospirillales bacterium]
MARPFFRMTTGWLALALGAAAVAGARAQEAIYGDFGLVLGQDFDQRLSAGRAMLFGNVEAERFQPSYPLYLFRDYYAVVTPRSRQVAGIVAESVPFASMPECVTHLNAVQAYIARYGTPRMTQQTDTEVLLQVEQGNRAAYLRCNRGQFIRMELNYVDFELLNRRAQETGR